MDKFRDNIYGSKCNYDYNETSDRCNNRDGRRRTCREFANMLNASIITSMRDVCLVGFNRNIRPKILGRPARSSLAIGGLVSFESMDNMGRTLNLGEIVLLQEEVDPFMTALRKRGIEVTALHNHWLFDCPRLMYMHFMSVEDPMRFARKVSEAMRVFKC